MIPMELIEYINQEKNVIEKLRVKISRQKPWTFFRPRGAGSLERTRQKSAIPAGKASFYFFSKANGLKPKPILRIRNSVSKKPSAAATARTILMMPARRI